MPIDEFFAELVSMTNGGRTNVNMFDVGSRIGVSRDVAEVIALELKDRKLVILGLGGGIVLTSKGKAKGEGYNVGSIQGKPDVIAVINGPVTDSQIAVGTRDVTQGKPAHVKEEITSKVAIKRQKVDGLAVFGICLTVSGFFLIPPLEWLLGGILAVAISAVVTGVAWFLLSRNKTTGRS